MTDPLRHRCPKCTGHRESGNWLCSSCHAKHIEEFEARRNQWNKGNCGSYVNWDVVVKVSKQEKREANYIKLHKKITDEVDDYIPSRNYGNWSPFYRLEDTSPWQDNAIRAWEDGS